MEGTEVVAEEANTEQMEDLVNQVVETAEIAEPEVEAETAEKAVEITDTEMEVNLEETETVGDVRLAQGGIAEEELEIVHATAEFENLPNRNLTEDDILSLQSFICSEDHLTRNIANIAIDLKENGDAQIKLHVRRKNLWESPKNYIWKFLGGDNYWAKQNGTKIRLRRIHVK